MGKEKGKIRKTTTESSQHNQNVIMDECRLAAGKSVTVSYLVHDDDSSFAEQRSSDAQELSLTN